MKNQTIVKTNDHEFVITKLNAIDQVKMLVSLTGLFAVSSLFPDEKAKGHENEQAFLSITKAIASLSKESLDSLLNVTLDNVYYKNEQGVYPIYSNGVCSYDDLDWGDIVGLIIANVRFNIGNFTQVSKKIEQLSGMSITLEQRKKA